MMEFLVKNAKVDLECPNCGRKFKQTLGRMQRDFDCPGCGVRFDAKGVAKGTKEVEKALKNFARDIKKMFG